jgi:ADP-heptose:LPS heptosyltransferase
MKKILIIKHGALGDIVLSMHAIFSIKNHYDKPHITILTEEVYKDFFKSFSFINSIKIDNRPKFYNFFEFIKLIKWFKKNNFDWVYDLQTSTRTNIYFFIFSLFKSFKWNGIANKCSHPHLNKNRINMHTLDRQKEQLKNSGVNTIYNIDWAPLKENSKKFKIKKPYAILVPGASKHRLNKRWDYKNFIEIIKFLSKNKILSIIVGAKHEEDILKKEEKNYDVLNLIGKTTFNDLANISRQAFLVLGNDTGPMHLLVVCSPLKSLKIVLFGSGSDPKLCAPRGKNIHILRKKDINQISLLSVKKIIKKKL